MQLRYYQQESINALYKYLRERDDNPCIVLPTAAGKTPVIAQICRDAVTNWGGRVLIMAHVKELLQQTCDKLHAICRDINYGVYSAGLGMRDTRNPVIVAGIQSAFKRGADLGKFDLVLIDEAHLIPPDGEGMYRTLIESLKVINPDIRIVGLTATPYRMNSGAICSPENILNKVCYEIGVKELIVKGFICPVTTKSAEKKVDTSELRIRAGEFIPEEVEALVNGDPVVSAACAEIILKTEARKSVLIFASGIEHANHVKRILELTTKSVETVFGETESEARAEILKRFKSGETKYLINVAVLTTGFDAPNVDCVVLLRPTCSPGLYYQMVGRGFRLYPDKSNCLVLDFGENALRHGPVDAIKISDKSKAGSTAIPAPAKECPHCLSVIAASYGVCPDCGEPFPKDDLVKQKHNESASKSGVISGEEFVETYAVENVHYFIHEKRGALPDAPKTMRVEYCTGFNRYQCEWVCVEHNGFARRKAETWWKGRADPIYPFPTSAQEAVALCEGGAVKTPLAITVRQKAGDKFEEIISYEFEPEKAKELIEALNIPVEDIPF